MAINHSIRIIFIVYSLGGNKKGIAIAKSSSQTQSGRVAHFPQCGDTIIDNSWSHVPGTRNIGLSASGLKRFDTE